MTTISDYLTQLQTDKATLVDNLTTKGVTASDDETFTELVPKVLDIPSGGDVTITDASYLFYGGSRLDSINELLSVCKNVTRCIGMFQACDKLTNINLSNFDTSSVINMTAMFSGCNDLLSLDLSNFDTSSVTNMNNMFNNCNSLLSLDLSNFDTSSVINMNNMIYGCSSLTNINLSNFDTSSVTNMNSMFYNCYSLASLDLSNFDTSNVTSNSYMFYSAGISKLIINRQDVFKMTNTAMFSNTPIAGGTGYVYVPDNMVETYKSATNWSTYADQIKGMSELPTEEI